MVKAKAKTKTKAKTKQVVKSLSNAQIEFINGADSVLCYNDKNKLEFFCKSAEEARAFFSFNTVTRHNVHFGISYLSPEQEAEAKAVITAQAEGAQAPEPVPDTVADVEPEPEPTGDIDPFEV